MAETLISPGVLARENDISFIAPAPLEAGAALLGPTVKGPVEEPTVVTSFGQYQRVFGTTFASGSNKYEYLTSLAAKSYFEQGGNSVLVTRVVSGSFASGQSTNISFMMRQNQTWQSHLTAIKLPRHTAMETSILLYYLLNNHCTA